MLCFIHSKQQHILHALLCIVHIKQMLLLELAKNTGSNWGCDYHWCGAAEHFVKKRAQLAYYANQSGLHDPATDRDSFKYNLTTARPGCAVIAATPLRHLNFETIKKKEADWRKSAHHAKAVYRDVYRDWVYTQEHQQELRQMPHATVDELKAKCSLLK
jgi:succinate dehydrogenase/fumarate reductase-like Fe-S protein